MEIFDEKGMILRSCKLARYVCALKGMSLCLLQELLEEGILTDDITVVLSGYFETDGAFIDFDDTMEIVEEAEEIFKSEHSHSAWLRKAQQFRQCLKKLETEADKLGEGDVEIEYLEEDEE